MQEINLNNIWIYSSSIELEFSDEFVKSEIKMSPSKDRVPATACEVSQLKDEYKENDSKNRKLAETDDYLAVDETYRSSKVEYVPRITWPDFIALVFVHVGCIYGLYLIFTEAKLLTTLWGKCNRNYVCSWLLLSMREYSVSFTLSYSKIYRVRTITHEHLRLQYEKIHCCSNDMLENLTAKLLHSVLINTTKNRYITALKKN